MSLSLFVPVYNEEEIVREHLSKIYHFLSLHFDDFELVAVNDSSKDHTGEFLQELSMELERFRYVTYDNGPSRRENLAECMKKANYDIVGYMDLDLATPLPFLPNLYSYITSGSDIAIGSRRTSGAKAKRSAYRFIWSSLYHGTIRFLFESKIRDYQCGFKLFKKEVFIDLANKIGYDKKFQRGWFWDAEMLIQAEKRGYKISEMPVFWTEGKKSSFNLARELKTLGYIVRLRFR